MIGDRTSGAAEEGGASSLKAPECPPDPPLPQAWKPEATTTPAEAARLRFPSDPARFRVHFPLISVALPERTPPQSTNAEKRSVGKGLFRKCSGCGAVATVGEREARLQVCPTDKHPQPMPVRDWV